MELPEDVLEKGRITIYRDTPFELVKAAEEYNEHLKKCRKKSGLIVKIEVYYIVLNGVLGLLLTALSIAVLYELPVIYIPIILLNLFSYVFFTVLKRNFLFSIICTVLLVVVNLLFLILVAMDFLLFFMHRHIRSELKKEPAYPAFAELQVHYDRSAAPTEQYDDIWRQD